jgi:hypothetical protein|tara:strand:+ start:1643 stop:1825 length:183 start_codon:yes stop_codon:yes gene_type:complete
MSHNGYTQKEMLGLLLKGQDQLSGRIDELHEKVNSKISRSELLAWTTVLAVLIAGLSQFV